MIPVFLKQRELGILTLTDERMTRFWLSLEESVQLVIHGIEQMHGGEVFVAKSSSMKLIDLARAIAPKAKLETVGIRRGEKLHDLLISEDEARYTIELDRMFVILPPESAARCDFDWNAHGQRLPDGYRYASDNNSDWLDVEQVQRLLAELE